MYWRRTGDCDDCGSDELKEVDEEKEVEEVRGTSCANETKKKDNAETHRREESGMGGFC